jgi:hypothetical protein
VLVRVECRGTVDEVACPLEIAIGKSTISLGQQIVRGNQHSPAERRKGFALT